MCLFQPVSDLLEMEGIGKKKTYLEITKMLMSLSQGGNLPRGPQRPLLVLKHGRIPSLLLSIPLAITSLYHLAQVDGCRVSKHESKEEHWIRRCRHNRVALHKGIQPLVDHAGQPFVSDPKVGRVATVSALDVGNLRVGEGAATDSGEHDALGQGRKQAVVARCDGFGEETHLDWLAALEGKFGRGEASTDLYICHVSTMFFPFGMNAGGLVNLPPPPSTSMATGSSS